jgi:hypothetical protein
LGEVFVTDHVRGFNITRIGGCHQVGVDNQWRCDVVGLTGFFLCPKRFQDFDFAIDVGAQAIGENQPIRLAFDV